MTSSFFSIMENMSYTSINLANEGAKINPTFITFFSISLHILPVVNMTLISSMTSSISTE